MSTITDAEAVIAQLIKLCKAQQGLLAAYRSGALTGGSLAPAKHIDNAKVARTALKEMGLEL